MAKNPFQGDDVDPFSGARDEDGGIKREEPKKAEKKKDRVVTKEEMKKAGFDNLRDFLNAERGLKRRKDKSAEKGPDKATLDRIARKQSEEDKGPSDADLDRLKKKFDTRAGEKGRDPSRYGKPVTLDELGFKKGGSVSSASKRADGCAIRGKTKGRMV
jgi:hypothetical protein